MNRPVKPFLDFDEFRVDTANYRLFRNGQEILLAPKVFETLLALIESPGQLVGKNELMERLWPGTFVGEDALAQKVSLLRKALGRREGAPEYIYTVPKLGYRFDGIVTSSEAGGGIHATAESGVNAVAMPGAYPASRRHNRWHMNAIVSCALLCILAAGWLAVRRLTASAVIANYRIQKLDVSNTVDYGVISPGGKHLAYVSYSYGKKSLWIRPIASSGKGLAVVPETSASFWGITFSPDEEYIYYVMGGFKPDRGTLFRINAMGGSPQELLDGIDGAVAFEPGGRRMVFKRYPNTFQRNGTELVVASADGTDSHPIASSNSALAFLCYHWSSADKIVYATGEPKPGGIDWYVAEIPSNGGKENKVFGPIPTPIRAVQATSNSEFVALANDPQSGLGQLWVFNRTGGVRRLTNDTNEYMNLSFTPNGQTMIATLGETEDTLWVANANQSPGERIEILKAKELNIPQGSYDHPVWTPDGNIVYLAFSGGGNKEMRWISADGTQQRRLTSNGADNRDEDVSPDGKFVVFTVNSGGSRNIWRIDMFGADPLQLTHSGVDGNPRFSPSGKWVVFSSFVAGKWGIWKMPSGGGPAVRIADSILTVPAISPDEKSIAFEHESSASEKPRWGVFSFNDGSLQHEIDLPKNATGISWSRDGKSLIYELQSSAGQSLWSQPISGQDPWMIVDIGSVEVPNVDWSKDGKRIVFLRRKLKADLVLIDAQR